MNYSKKKSASLLPKFYQHERKQNVTKRTFLTLIFLGFSKGTAKKVILPGQRKNNFFWSPQKKSEKNVALSSRGEGGKALVARPLKEEFFFGFPYIFWKIIILKLIKDTLRMVDYLNW